MLLLTSEPTHQKIPFKHSSIEPLGNGKGAAVSRWFGFCCLPWAATVHMKLSHGSYQQLSRSLFPINVRLGSLADITRWIGEVRFTLKSRHVPSRHQCLLSAKSGHERRLR
jgi:hypothetical protein